ncbi:PQQ-binding-like beta-propeller repeat protein [Galbibacter sp. BG1]|uniref:outer membrane protein assembly factor BamB family protein n=1 Tax=Galbibacter sp. BG1 TaxID=1170699 RepID=UPI0015BFC605|nr:PQQ-binding-like beta-propeller repeat protein [Galbibacter sp. BG1]QLE02457.1 PQQ-binding-like beta-propeller repeat protein [Galbibacter sp. BG1]
MKLKLISALLLMFVCRLNAQGNFLSSGDEELDSIRLAVKKNPTSAETFQLRAFKMKLWMVILQQQGARLDPFVAIDNEMAEIVWWNTIFWNEGKPQDFTPDEMDKLCDITDRGYEVLEYTQKDLRDNPRKIIKASPDAQEVPTQENPINWTHYKGNNGLNGYTGAEGPQLGENVWKYPVGLPWESEPVVEGNRVYLSSPGMRTAMLCVDLESGETIWDTTQQAEIMGDQLYNTPSNMATPVVLEDFVLYRETGSRGNKGPTKEIVFVDKKSGEIDHEVLAGHVDYRVGLPTVTANEEFLVYTHGVQDIEAIPPIAQAYNRVVCKDTHSGKLLWDFNIGYTFADPLLVEDRVFIGNQTGYMYAMKCGEKYGPVDKRRIAWEFRAAGSINEKATNYKDYLFFGDNSGRFYCLNNQNGEKIWEFKVKDTEQRSFRHFSRAFVVDGKVFVGAADKMIYCFDVKSGELLFSYLTDDWIRAKPVAKDDRLYFATMKGSFYGLDISRKKPKLIFRKTPGDHPVIADLVITSNKVLYNDSDLYTYTFNLNGDLLWKKSLVGSFINDSGNRIFTDEIAGGARYMSKPTAANGLVYFGSPIRFVYAVDANNGKEKWKFEAGASLCGAPVYDNDKIYFGVHSGEDEFYCLDAQTGEVIWKQDVGWVWGSPNVSDGIVYISGIDGNVQALDANNGQIIWRHRLDRSICSEPAVEGDQVFFGSWDHYLYGMNKKTGNINWKFHLSGGTDSGVQIVKDGKIYLPIGGPRFRCLNAKTGEVLWEFTEPKTNFNVTPAYHNGKVYCSNWYGIGLGGICTVSNLYCLDAETGEKVWQGYGGGLSGPVIGANGDVYIASVSSPYFYCYDGNGNPDGSAKIKWMYKMGNKVEESTPALYNGKAYIMSSDGYIHAIK